MRKIEICLVLCFVSFVTLAQKTVVLVPNKATVYLQNVLLEHSFNVSLSVGNQEIILEDVANTIDVNSIKVGGKGDLVLLGIKHGPNHLNTKTLVLQDTIKMLEKGLKNLNMQLNVANQEEKMIMANANIKSEQDGLSPEELKEMVVVFRAKLSEVGLVRLDLEQKILEKNEEIKKIRDQYNAIKGSQAPLGQIVLKVNAKSATNAQFELSYLAYNAGWKSMYDIRVKDIKNPVELVYKAEVWQNTGLDLKDLSLSLSTQNPSANANKPELYPQFLSIYVPRVVEAYQTKARAMKVEESDVPMAMEVSAAVVDEAPAIVSNEAELKEGSLSISYDLKSRYSLKNGGLTETVEIKTTNTPAVYKTMIVPKLDTKAYLVAELSEWQGLNLQDGEASIYFENAYVGKSYISTQMKDQKMRLSLGQDTRVQAQREFLEKTKNRKAFGSSIKESFGYTLIINNLKTTNIDIEIEDQIPVSQDSQIEVETEEISGGILEEKTGKITWQLNLGALEQATKLLKYIVKYPKDKQIVNLN